MICLFSKCFCDYSLIYQLSSHSLLRLRCKCLCHTLIAQPVCFSLCVCFCKGNPHPRGLSEMPLTSYDSLWGRWLCVWLECLRSEKGAFWDPLNVASVCVWMLSTGLECVFISTHGSPYCRVKMTLGQMRRRKKTAGLRATVSHTGENERGWYPVVLFVCFSRSFSGKSETLVILSCSQRNAVHVFFHAVVDVVCLLWSFYCVWRGQAHFVFTLGTFWALLQLFGVCFCFFN